MKTNNNHPDFNKTVLNILNFYPGYSDYIIAEIILIDTLKLKEVQIIIQAEAEKRK